MKRSVALLLLVVLLTAAGCDRDRVGWQRSVQANVNPAELEQWATNCIAKGVVSTNDASEQIRQLMLGAHVSIATDSGSGHKAVVFMHGGGFGHWAVVVGPPDYKCMMGNRRAYWTNGVWFAWE